MLSTMYQPVLFRWAFMDYAVISPQERLLEKGEAIWEGGALLKRETKMATKHETWAELRTWDVRFWITGHTHKCVDLAAHARAIDCGAPSGTREALANLLRLTLSQNRHWLPAECRSDEAIDAVDWRFATACLLDHIQQDDIWPPFTKEGA